MSDWLICGIYFLGVAVGAFGHAAVQSARPHNPRPAPDVDERGDEYYAGVEDGVRSEREDSRNE